MPPFLRTTSPPEAEAHAPDRSRLRGAPPFARLHAPSSRSEVRLRDFYWATDNWYDELAGAGSLWRYETTRTARSVLAPGAPAVAPRDDLPGNAPFAQPITVVNLSGTPIWWGNGWNAYPNFEDLFDTEAVPFWGQAGARFQVDAAPIGGSPVDLNIAVYRYDPAWTVVASGYAPSGPAATVQTSALPADDWYVAMFSSRAATTGAWSARISPYGSGATLDTLDSDLPTSYPMYSGDSVTNRFDFAGDADAFKIFVPTNAPGTQLTITASAASGPIPAIDLYRRTPTGYTQHSSSTTGSLVASTSAYGVTDWAWQVRDWTSTGARGYTTTAQLDCAAWDCDDLTPFVTPIAARETWGDKLAGRLEAETWRARYSVTLAQYQHASFSIVDARGTPSECTIQMDLRGPSTMDMFGGERVWRQRDGPAASDPAGNNHDRVGGGHIIAPVAGDYTVQLEAWGGTDCWYRLFIAKDPGLFSTARPAW